MAEIILNDDNFEQEVLASDIPVLVDFWAEWCGPCKMLGPIIAQIAEEQEGKVKVCKANVDDCMEIAGDYNVASIPTVILFKNGEEADRSIGFKPKDAIEAMLG